MFAKSNSVSPAGPVSPSLKNSRLHNGPKPMSHSNNSHTSPTISLLFSPFNPLIDQIENSPTSDSEISDSNSDSEPAPDSPNRTFNSTLLEAHTKQQTEDARQLMNIRRLPEGNAIKNLFPKKA